MPMLSVLGKCSKWIKVWDKIQKYLNSEYDTYLGLDVDLLIMVGSL